MAPVKKFKFRMSKADIFVRPFMQWNFEKYFGIKNLL
jgi:hypothetical protein